MEDGGRGHRGNKFTPLPIQGVGVAYHDHVYGGEGGLHSNLDPGLVTHYPPSPQC